MGPEGASNASSNLTDDDFRYERRPDFYERLFLELFTAVCLVSALANVLIIFVVVKYKKLRRQPTNIIMAHLGLLEILDLLATPMTIRIVDIISNYYYDGLHFGLICAAYENEFFLTVGICLFLFLLVCDWYLKTYNEARYVKFCRVYKYFVAGIYCWVILLSVVGTPFCFFNYFSLPVPLIITLLGMILFYGLLFLFLIVMNIVHAVKKSRLRENKQNVGLFVANMFFVLWIPIVIILMLTIFMRIHFSPELPIVAFSMGFTSPVTTCLYLFYYVDTFNVFFKKVFKCQCNDYENELLEEQTVAYSDTNGVKI